MAAAGALESGDLELEPRLQLLRGHARVSLLARHLNVITSLTETIGNGGRLTSIQNGLTQKEKLHPMLQDCLAV